MARYVLLLHEDNPAQFNPLALAGSCPHLDFGWIEVRQIHELPPAPPAS